MLETYTISQIKEAVDIAIGDDGFRSKEVIEILRLDNEEFQSMESHKKTLLQIIKKMQALEQNIINVDAKYKIKHNEILSKIKGGNNGS